MPISNNIFPQGNSGGGQTPAQVKEPIYIDSGKTAIRDSSITVKGAVQLTSDATDKTSENKAVTSKGVEAHITAVIENDISDITSTTKVTSPKFVKDLINQSQLSPNILASVYGASISNIALTGAVTYKGLKIPNGSRWLAAGQSDAKTNGIYLTNDSGLWTRTIDADTAAELYLAQVTAVNADAGQYLCTISNTAVIGTSDITFIQLYKADNQYVGVQLYNPAAVYAANTLIVNPSVDQYIYRCLIDGTNNITPSMASNNWEIYQGLLYQNSAIVAPNGNDTKTDGFPYATYSAAITDLSTGAYIEGRAVTTAEVVTPKAGMYLAGKNAQVTKVVLSVNDAIVDGINLLATVANPVPISIIGATNSNVRNLIATANGASNSTEVTGNWDGVHKLSNLKLIGNISISGITTAGVFVISDILSTVTLTLNCANARVYIQNCPNLTLVETSGEIIADTNPNVIYVSTTGVDTNNGSSYYTAKKTLGAAGALAGGSGKQIGVYPGIYPETSSLTNQNLSITSLNQEAGGLVSFINPITLNPPASSIRVSGITFATLNKQGAGGLKLTNCTTNTFTDSGSGFLQLINTDTQGSSLTGTVSITGAGNKSFMTDCTTGTLTINNASASVTLFRNMSVLPITLTSGLLGIGGGNAIYAGTPTGNAISATGGILQIDGATILTPTNTSGRINIGTGVIYALKNIAYDQANSTISPSAVILPSDLVIDAQTNRVGTLSASGTIPVNQEFTICTAASANITATLGAAASAKGRSFKILNLSASTFNVILANITPNLILLPGQSAFVESDGTTWRSLNNLVAGFTVGDTKTGMQTGDHSGWIRWTNGRSLSRTTYASLWAFVQANSLVTAALFGNGDGSTTFTMGDVNGRSIGIAGSGTGLTTRSLGNVTGAETVTLAIGEIPSHKVRISMIPGSAGVPEWNDPDTGSSSRNWSTAGSSGPNSKQSGYSDSIGGGASHNNMQPSVFFNLFVYAGV